MTIPRRALTLRASAFAPQGAKLFVRGYLGTAPALLFMAS